MRRPPSVSRVSHRGSARRRNNWLPAHGFAAGAMAALTALALSGCLATAPRPASQHGDHHGVNPAVPAPATLHGPTSPYEGLELVDPYMRPSFTLTDTSGSIYDFRDVTAGLPTLLFFGYTHCPDVCPTTMADIAVALRNLGPVLQDEIQVVFVTTDPSRDSPAVLRAWLDQFDLDLPRPFVGLTGTQGEIDRAQLAAGVPLAESRGELHSSLVLLYGKDEMAHVVFDAENTSSDITHDLRLVARSN